MKKTFLALATLGAFAGAAHAQNAVTLYGVIDEGLDYTSNAGGHKQWALSASDVQNEGFGLKGSEDLGGGLSAIFALEAGFDINNGSIDQQGQLFGRQAYIGLSSTTFGQVTLGRQYDSIVDYVAPLTANGSWGGGMFMHPYDADNTDNTFRLNNALKYTSANYNGLSFTGAYAFSNSTNFAANRAESVAAQYQYGGLTAAVGYLYVGSPNSSKTGAVAVGPNGSEEGSWTAARHEVFGAGVNYALGAATLGLVYTHTDIKSPTGTVYADLEPGTTLGAAQRIKFDNIELNGQYNVTPALMLGAMYTYTIAQYDGATGNAKPKYHTAGLMADYSLSKRTDVYVQGAYVHVADASSAAGTGLEVAMNPDAAAASTSTNQLMARVALRHKF